MATQTAVEPKRLTKKQYEKELVSLQVELVRLQEWISHAGLKVVVIFEGRDTAGKGGSIHMFANTLNPRQCHVVALPAPSARESDQWYFQRYVQHFPARGEISLFDRSWYNRAGVEAVMGFASSEQVTTFLKAVPDFEKQLVDDGIYLFKYWLCCDQEKQEDRFADRLNNPLRRWKLSPVDLQARQLYDAYTEARERMLAATDSPHAPWTLVDFNDQRLGRLTLLRDLLDRLPDTKLPVENIPWPKLKHEPIKERYGVMKPLPLYRWKESED
jgi:polyphosphate kinase 2